MSRMIRVAGVDPGGEHQGYAVIGIHKRRPCTLYTTTFTRGELLAHLSVTCPEYVVIEEFRLFRTKASALSFSAMPTAEVIGQVKAVVAGYGGIHIMQQAKVKQKARDHIKELELAPMVRRRIGSVSPYVGWDFDIPGPAHCRDALAHAWYYTLHAEPSVIDPLPESP